MTDLIPRLEHRSLMHVEPMQSLGIPKVISVSRLSLPITPIALAIQSVLTPAPHHDIRSNDSLTD